MRGLLSASAVLAFALALVIDAGAVHGQGEAAAGSARDVAEQARQDHAAGRKQAAIDGYKRAYEMSGDAELLFRLGEVSRELGQDVAALRFYNAYVTRSPRGKNREAADRASRSIELGRSRAPAKQPAPAGPAAAPTSSAPVQSARTAATSPPPPASPPPPRASPPPPASPPPLPASPPAPASPAGASSAAPMVDLRAEPAQPAQPPDPPLPRGLPWAGLGATLALGAGAIVTGLSASSRYDELRASCGQTVDGCSQTQIDEVKSRALTANLLWAAASVGAVATGVFVYVNTREAGLSGLWSF